MKKTPQTPLKVSKVLNRKVLKGPKQSPKMSSKVVKTKSY